MSENTSRPVSGYAVHPVTARQISRFIEHPSHALVLVAPEGSGKQALLRFVTIQILGLPIERTLDSYPYLKIVEPEVDKTSISIEAVRGLHHYTSLKLPDKAAYRIIHILEAQDMGHEAQNSLLKLLEEPPANTIFMMTTTSSQRLLPTIRSRVQQITVHRPSRSVIETYFTGKGFDSRAIASSYLLSGGLVGLMSALLNDSKNTDGSSHPLKQSVLYARQILQMTQFERLGQVDNLSKKKADSVRLLFVLKHMAQAAIEQSSAVPVHLAANDSAATSANRSIKQWHRVLRACYDAEHAFSVSAQAKLTLTNLMLRL